MTNAHPVERGYLITICGPSIRPGYEIPQPDEGAMKGAMN